MLCQIPTEPTCDDGLINQGETNIDCGGPCEICKTCNDQIENCHDGDCEKDIDCGGPCAPCIIKEASHSVSFWAVLIGIILILIILFLGFWYYKLKVDVKVVSDELKITKKPTKYFRL